uniref:Uncharacterized protein n=1 Tax=Tetranychus urticae TaxID=32264 RepID=T1KEZ8_TETUR
MCIMDPIMSKLGDNCSNSLIVAPNSSFFIKDILSENELI